MEGLEPSISRSQIEWIAKFSYIQITGTIGLEPMTHRLTADRSAAELHSKKEFCFFFYSKKEIPDSLFYYDRLYEKCQYFFKKNYNLIYVFSNSKTKYKTSRLMMKQSSDSFSPFILIYFIISEAQICNALCFSSIWIFLLNI